MTRTLVFNLPYPHFNLHPGILICATPFHTIFFLVPVFIGNFIWATPKPNSAFSTLNILTKELVSWFQIIILIISSTKSCVAQI